MANWLGVVALLVGVALALGPLPLGGALLMVTGSIGLAIAWESPEGELLGERQGEREVAVGIGPEVGRLESR